MPSKVVLDSSMHPVLVANGDQDELIYFCAVDTFFTAQCLQFQITAISRQYDAEIVWSGLQAKASIVWTSPMGKLSNPQLLGQ